MLRLQGIRKWCLYHTKKFRFDFDACSSLDLSWLDSGIWCNNNMFLSQKHRVSIGKQHAVMHSSINLLTRLCSLKRLTASSSSYSSIKWSDLETQLPHLQKWSFEWSSEEFRRRFGGRKEGCNRKVDLFPTRIIRTSIAIWNNSSITDQYIFSGR